MEKLVPSYEKCPKHQQNDILLFCISGQCLEPLCKQCCKEHVALHNKEGSKVDIDTIDNIRANCFNDVHVLKQKFDEERGKILKYGDSENNEYIQMIHRKLEQAKQSLIKMVNEYCLTLEQEIMKRMQQHKQAHPGEQKNLIQKITGAVNELEKQEKALAQPKYLRNLLQIMMEEQNHDLEGTAKEVDTAVNHYMENIFDLFIHEDVLQKIRRIQFAQQIKIGVDLEKYVEIHQVQKQVEENKYGSKNQQKILSKNDYNQLGPIQSQQLQNSQQLSNYRSQPNLLKFNPPANNDAQSQSSRSNNERIKSKNYDY